MNAQHRNDGWIEIHRPEVYEFKYRNTRTGECVNELPDVSQQHLDAVEEKQWQFKTDSCRKVAGAIASHFATNGTGYPDEINFDFLPAADHNVIGTSFRRLIREGVLQHTGSHRNSKSKSANGRRIFECRVDSIPKVVSLVKQTQNS